MIATVSRRQKLELLLPGFVIGLLGGGFAGGLAGLADLGMTYALVSMLAFGVPLAAGGVGYSWLLASGKIRLGGIAPAAVYWLVGFLAARLIDQAVMGLSFHGGVTFGDGVGPFLLFQALLSLGWTIGFIWLHEHIAPHWWMAIREHNPIAAAYISVYLEQAGAMGPLSGPSAPIPSRKWRKQKAAASVPEPREPAVAGKRR